MDITEYTKNIPAGLLEFVREVKEKSPTPVLSIYVVGSVLTPDYQPERSDANSLFVVQAPETDFLDFLVGLGKRFGRQRVAPPLIMTEDYIRRSLDVFPVEFYNFREIHYTLHGNDLLRNLSIDRGCLRLQCEREIRAKLLWLGQIYLETLAENNELCQKMSASITGYIPIFRAILHLAGHEIHLAAQDTAAALETLLEIDTDIFQSLYAMKRNHTSLCGDEELRSLYSRLYNATKKVSNYVDAMAK